MTGYPQAPRGIGDGYAASLLNRIGKLEALNADLIEALEQARAALPDAWFAVGNGVPREVIDLINKTLLKAGVDEFGGRVK
jgi:hypothetical protein